jgi:DNA primase
MIASEVIEEVRRLVDPVALIGRRVKLWKCGNGYSGSCPFHEEPEASFRVYPKEKRFVCFGCGASGDVFQFFQRADGKAFPLVVRELAASVGIVIPRDHPPTPEEQRGREERMALYAACEVAACHWQRNLWGAHGEKARKYLAGRGVRDETARAFRLGYALADWHDLERGLTTAHITARVQEAAGLVAVRADQDGSGRHYDRFRWRIMFPIPDAEGRVIGFGGRAIDADAEPRYLNGPETPLYKKSRTLYGLHTAREAIRRRGRAIAVEGYFDVLALHQAGLAEVVGTTGTALSSEQVGLLEASGCRELVLLFDADEAGSMAASRAGALLLQANLSTLVAEIPATVAGGHAPDMLVTRSGRRGVEDVLAAARPLTEFLIEDAIRRHAGGVGPQAAVEHKLAVIRALTPFVLAAPDGLPRSTFERMLARRLDIDIGPMRAEYRRAASTAEERAR